MSSSNGASATGLHLLSRAQIVAARDLEREVVEVPEWGGAVLVQAMDVNRRIAYYEFIFSRDKDPETGRTTYEVKDAIPFNAAVAALTIIDEQGEPVFTLDAVEELGAKNPDVLSRIADVGLRLSKMGKYAEVRAETPLAQSDDSPTDSQDTSDAPSPSLATA